MASRGQLFSNLLWKFLERVSAQLVSTVVSIILARLLMPEDYGVVALVMIFITLANVFVSDGLGSALIQKKDADELDFFSVLYINIGLSVAIYAVLYITSPWISAFYAIDHQQLTPILRVLGLRLILTAVNSVQNAYVAKKLMFRKAFVASLMGTIISGIVGITMAYARCGAWALVTQYLVSTGISTIVLMMILRKKPRLIFSMDRVKSLLPYGMRILGTGLLITGYQELRALIIGRKYSSTDLAYFNRGKQLPDLIINNVVTSISSVLFPRLSAEKEKADNVKKLTKMSVRCSSYIMCPMMLGMAVVAEPLIKVLMTDKWIESVPLMQLICIMNVFYPVHVANMQAVKAMGRSDVYLMVEILKKVVELVVLICVMNAGVKAIVIGMAVCANIFTIVNAWPNAKLIRYGIIEQMKDVLPSLVMSSLMCCGVYAISYIPMSDMLQLISQVTLGMVLYVALSVLTRNAEFLMIKGIVFGKLKR